MKEYLSHWQEASEEQRKIAADEHMDTFYAVVITAFSARMWNKEKDDLEKAIAFLKVFNEFA